MSKVWIILFLFFSSAINAEEWIQKEAGIECPDLIKFESNKYYIFNDCYGFDPKNPIIESGEFKKRNNVYHLFNRQIEQQSFLLNKSATVDLKVTFQPNGEVVFKNGSNHNVFKLIRLGDEGS
ncbi:hypothetical protein [uncultured Ferrimonas sp.]|uniref:hypothetical protein n=1 Tax=uncultured Ferrimonas sp. TaxID=432640 RepID=UPI00262AD0EB|nr:hypothetical protein [uncultured Ferrimonas sp.]